MLAVTIGNFDGVHRGHATLVETARRTTGPSGRTVAVTFEPHPISRLRPDCVPPRLTGAAERRRLLLEAGANEVIELDPTPQLLGLDAAAFVRELRGRLRFDLIVEGPDFRFGRARSGSIETLRAIAAADGFVCEVVPPIDVALRDGTLVEARSSLARWLLAQGRVDDASRVLGRPYALIGRAVPGDRRGRTIGVPTINLGEVETLLPGDAVYGGHATLADGRRFDAAISVGTKPSFGRSARVCEAHLLDAALPMDWYGHAVRVEFVHWVREQIAFPTLDRLLERMAGDIEAIRARLAAPRAPLIEAAS